MARAYNFFKHDHQNDTNFLENEISRLCPSGVMYIKRTDLHISASNLCNHEFVWGIFTENTGTGDWTWLQYYGNNSITRGDLWWNKMMLSMPKVELCGLLQILTITLRLFGRANRSDERKWKMRTRYDWNDKDWSRRLDGERSKAKQQKKSLIHIDWRKDG